MSSLPETPATWPTVRDLPFVARLVLAIYLISFGFGYLSALVQMHFQEAPAGELLPGPNEVLTTYHGGDGKMGQIERLITAPENLPFNGTGSMRRAFTRASAGWRNAPANRAKKRELPIEGVAKEVAEKNLAQAEQEVRAKNLMEADAIVAWIHAGYTEESYGSFEIPAAQAKGFDDWLAVEKTRFKQFDDIDFPRGIEFDPATKKWTADVKRIVNDRCVRCHITNGGGPAGQIGLEDYDNLARYIAPAENPAARGMSLRKLAQSTHLHLLSFGMLYLISGLFFAFTSYPWFLRLLIAPLPLIAQLLEIACWWLARMDAPYGPFFAMGIMTMGGIVAVGVGLQVLLGLFNLFRAFGKAVIALAIVGVLVCGHFFLRPIVEHQLKVEKTPSLLMQPAQPKK